MKEKSDAPIYASVFLSSLILEKVNYINIKGDSFYEAW